MEKDVLKIRGSYRCSACDNIILQAVLPGVEIPPDLKKESICLWCRIKNGSLIRLEVLKDDQIL